MLTFVYQNSTGRKSFALAPRELLFFVSVIDFSSGLFHEQCLVEPRLTPYVLAMAAMLYFCQSQTRGLDLILLHTGTTAPDNEP